LGLGGTRGGVGWQVLTGGVLISLLGGALGLVLAHWSLKLVVSLGRNFIPRVEEVGLDPIVLAFTLGASLLTGVIMGLVPAWQGADAEMNEALKDASRGSTGDGKQNRFRNGLLVAEVAVKANGVLRLARDPQGVVLSADLDQRAELCPPREQETSVAAARAPATDVGLEHDDVETRLTPLELDRRPEASVAATEDAHVGTNISLQRFGRRRRLFAEDLLEPERAMSQECWAGRAPRDTDHGAVSRRHSAASEAE